MRCFPSTGAAILFTYTHYLYVFKIYFKPNNIQNLLTHLTKLTARPLRSPGLDIYLSPVFVLVFKNPCLFIITRQDGSGLFGCNAMSAVKTP
jgi:hypothetical protein